MMKVPKISLLNAIITITVLVVCGFGIICVFDYGIGKGVLNKQERVNDLPPTPTPSPAIMTPKPVVKNNEKALKLPDIKIESIPPQTAGTETEADPILSTLLLMNSNMTESVEVAAIVDKIPTALPTVAEESVKPEVNMVSKGTSSTSETTTLKDISSFQGTTVQDNAATVTELQKEIEVADTTTTDTQKEVARAESRDALVPMDDELLKEQGAVPKIDNALDVRRIQAALKASGHSELKVNGVWSRDLRTLVSDFQNKNGLEMTGVPGKRTWPLLYAAATTSQTSVASANDVKAANAEEPSSVENTESKPRDEQGTTEDNEILALLSEQGNVPRIGNKNDIKRIQLALKLNGLTSEPVDGIWGPKTRDVVAKFQADNGLEVTKVPGKKTWALLYKNASKKISGMSERDKLDTIPDIPVVGTPEKLASPTTIATDTETQSIDYALFSSTTARPSISKPDDVKRLQIALHLLGKYDGPIDGNWSEALSKKISNYQVEHQLEVTGKPGPLTWKALSAEAREKLPDADSTVSHDLQSTSTEQTTEETPPQLPPAEVRQTSGALMPPTELSTEGRHYSKEAETDYGEVNAALITRVQKRLNDLGYNIGMPTGTIGPRTEKAIKTIQSRNKLSQTGNLNDKKTLDAIFTGGVENGASYGVMSNKESTINIPQEIKILDDNLHMKAKDSNEEDVLFVRALLDKARKADSDTAIILLNEAANRIEKMGQAHENDAQKLFEEVKSKYIRLTDMFGDKIKKDSKSTYNKLENAYTAMKSDLTNKKYNDVVRLGPGFKNTLDRLTTSLSKDYVSRMLKTPEMTQKLSEKMLSNIKSLQNQGKYVEAASAAKNALKANTSPDKKNGKEK